MAEDTTTRIDSVRYITYYPKREDKAAGWSYKGQTDGERVKAWASKAAGDKIKDQLVAGETNDWGGINYSFAKGETRGLMVSFKKVTFIEAKGTGKMRERGGKIVTMNSLYDLARKCAVAGSRVVEAYEKEHGALDEPARAEIAQKYAVSLFIAGCDAGEAHVEPPAPEPDDEEEEPLDEKPKALEEEEDDDLPF
jgi:hypothetical protein